MKTNILMAKALFYTLIKDSNISLFTECKEDWFIEAKSELQNISERDLFKFIHNHYKVYSVFPDLEVMSSYGVNLELDIQEIPLLQPCLYYFEYFKKRYIKNRFNDVAKTFLQFSKSPDIIDDNIKYEETLTSLLKDVKSTTNKDELSTLAEQVQGYCDSYKKDLSNKNSISGVTTGFQGLDEVTDGIQPGDIFVLAARPNIVSMVQPLNSHIYLSDGSYKYMRDVKIGDNLMSLDGAESIVNAIYPQEVKDIYKITLVDGREVECCKDHLWKVYYRQWETDRILSTEKIIDLLSKKRYKNRLSIDYISGEFGNKAPSIEPYLLGCLLGDGCLRSGSIHIESADIEIIDLLNSRLTIGKFRLVPSSVRAISKSCSYSLVQDNRYHRNILQELGVYNCLSYDKFIPAECFTYNKRDRLELFRGLLDTDGKVCKIGKSVSYCSASIKLAKDMQRLAWSLGYYAKLTHKRTNYQTDAYVLFISNYKQENMFNLSRHQNKLTGRYKKRRSIIKSISLVCKAECQGISVSHRSNLYVTNDYIITHGVLARIANKCAFAIQQTRQTELRL